MQRTVGCQYQAQDYTTGTSPPVQPQYFGSGFELYKGKSAVQFKPIAPTYARRGANTVLHRKGVLLMDAAVASGQRVYAWDNKVTFALSVLEMSQVFLEDFDKIDQLQLFHDPGMQSQAQGQVRKTLSVSQGQDGNTLMFSFYEKSGNKENRVTVPVTRSEFRVVTEMAKYLIPHFLGLDRYVDTQINQSDQ